MFKDSVGQGIRKGCRKNVEASARKRLRLEGLSIRSLRTCSLTRLAIGWASPAMATTTPHGLSTGLLGPLYSMAADFPQQVSQGSQMQDVLPFMSWPQESQSITSAVITRRLRFPGKECRPPPLAGKSHCRNSMWDGRYCCSHFWKSACSRRSKSLDE